MNSNEFLADFQNNLSDMLSLCPSPSSSTAVATMQRSGLTSHLSSVSTQQQQTTTTTTSGKPTRYQYGYTPLRQSRQLHNNICYTIVSNVECIIEITKMSQTKQAQVVREFYRFKFDEDKIWVYKGKKLLPFNLNEVQQCPLNASCFSLDELPSEYWNKYITACKFMTLVRSKTAKITIYSKVGKAVLYDAPGFFELHFLADSTKIIFNGTITRIITATGKKNYKKNN